MARILNSGSGMTGTLSPPPVLLIAGACNCRFSQSLERFDHVVVRAPSAKLSLDFARSLNPDAILVDYASLDVPGIDFCAQLRRDVQVGTDIPVLAVLPTPPTPEMRVSGIRAGVWDYLCGSDPEEEVVLKIEMHVQAKRSLQAAAVDGLVNRTSGVLTRLGFTQRLRELGALMIRMRGGLSCVMFVFTGGPQDGTEATLIAGAARTSDVVGALSHSEIAVVTPATGQAGAVRFAHRMGAMLYQATKPHPVLANVSVQAGCASVGNLRYTPINPIHLLNHSARAVTDGIADAEHPWIRHFAGLAGEADAGPSPAAEDSGQRSSGAHAMWSSTAGGAET
ncbi:MAG: response regulator [Gemmatimonadaceae bacterium]